MKSLGGSLRQALLVIAASGGELPSYHFQEKILAKIIIKWILNTVDQELGKEQVRFREGKKCGELIFSFKISSGNAQSEKTAVY